MFEWKTLRRGSYILIDEDEHIVGGFVYKGEDTLWSAVGQAELREDPDSGKKTHHHPIYGEFRKLKDAKEAVEAAIGITRPREEEEVVTGSTQPTHPWFQPREEEAEEAEEEEADEEY